MNQLRQNGQQLQVFTDNKETARKLMDKLSCFEAGYAHSTLYRMGKWDGKRKFYDLKPVQGGWYFLTNLSFSERVSEIINESLPKTKIEQPSPIEFLKREIPKLPFTPYKHQIKLFMGMVSNYNHLGVSSVGSGKSLAIYLLIKYFLELNKKILLLVPTIMLVNQMYQDFIDYGGDEEFMDLIQQIGGEFKDKDIQKPVVISTWQSAQKSNLKLFNIVINDEAHTAKAEVLDDILQNNNFERKLGVTGSMPIIELDAMILESNFAAPVRYINARQMMDLGLATELSIVAMYLNYPQIPKNQIKTYQDEIRFMKDSLPRQVFVNKLLKKLDGVTVALYAHTEHGVKTWENYTGVKLTPKIKQSFDLQKEHGVFFLTGKTKPSLREQIRIYLNQVENAHVIAQYAIMSTGINIPRLKNLVYLSSNKSFTATLQSIGRVLRLHKDKSRAVVYDLIDCMSGTRKDENYLQKHFWERNNYYQQEQFPVVEKEIQIHA